MRTAFRTILLGAVIGCGSGADEAGGGSGGGGSAGHGAGGSGGAGGAFVEPVTCDSMCHHIYWGCGRVLVFGGERLVGKPQCVSACEGQAMDYDVIQCLGTAPCTDEGIRACFGPPPEPTCDNVCYLGNQCGLMPTADCLYSCHRAEMTEAQRECLIAAGLQCSARRWEACLE